MPEVYVALDARLTHPRKDFLVALKVNLSAAQILGALFRSKRVEISPTAQFPVKVLQNRGVVLTFWFVAMEGFAPRSPVMQLHEA
jgi:hypothetical protein